jgi:hypothetical protein
MGCRCFCVLVLGCLVAASAAPDADRRVGPTPRAEPNPPPPTAKQVLDAYERTLGMVQSWSMHVTTTTRFERPRAKGRDRAGMVEWSCVYHRDGDRYDLAHTVTEQHDADGNLLPPGPDDGNVSRSIVNGWWIGYYGRPGGGAAQAYFRGDGRRHLRKALAAGGAEVLDGYLSDDFSILDVFRKAKDVTVRDGQVVDGAPCVRLDAALAEHGRWSVWFDPSAGHLPRRVELIKADGDLIWDGERIGAKGRRYIPQAGKAPTTMDRVTYVADAFQLRKVDGGLLPVACKVYQEVRFADGNAKRSWLTTLRGEIDLGPDFAKVGAFVPDLREGQPLINEDDRNELRWWRGGKPVKSEPGPGL